jgi:GNAT superfamily N-acetyltransferase
MLQVRTYEGDAAPLAAFIGSVWRASYAGKMPLPIWDEPYFNWQLLWRPPAERPYCLAAYDGKRLVGTLLGEEFRFRWLEREHIGTQGSWLSVDPEYRRQGVAALLRDELVRRHRERNADFQIGYGYQGSRLSMGPKFWKTFPKDTFVPKTLGFRARVIDDAAVAEWELNRFEGTGAKMLGWWQKRAVRYPLDPHVRPYESRDLPACLELSHSLLDRVQAGIVWERERLAHQLDYKGYPRTLVYDQDGMAAGFINYHVLNFLGRTTIRVAMIDLFAPGELDGPAARALMQTALRRMADDAVALCLILRTPCFPVGVLWRTGFIPRPADQAILLTRINPAFDVAGARRFHVLWR